MRSKTFAAALSLTATLIVAMVAGATPALAESHPLLFSFGSFSKPNGIAIDESSGDVYVADIATNTVYKFDANGNPVEFSALHSNALTGSATPAGAFAFPTEARGNPAAIAIDNSRGPTDPSAGDLYVMDAGNGVIDKFDSGGKYLSQITGFPPATGSSEHELLGLGIDASGTVRVELDTVGGGGQVMIDQFDDSSANHLVAEQVNRTTAENNSGLPQEKSAHGFAVGPTGDDYLLYEGCSCTGKLGQQLAGLGPLDNRGSGDVAVAADPATGHVYVDDQSSGGSSVTEWDTGAINGSPQFQGVSPGVAALVSSFGSLQLSGSSGQGGIAVNGASGNIYVADPGEGNQGKGKVYVFGSDAPAVTVGAAAGVTKETATLTGTVNPRGASVAPCQFEYGVADEFGQGSYENSVSCVPDAGALGAGTSPVPVSAAIGALKAGLLYRFRLKTENASGAGEGSGLFGTLGEGFGVRKFEVSFLNEDGSPDTQAGSHPYELVNNIEFNSHFLRKESNADSPYVQEPDGALKDLFVDLPPGVVGDPNATAKKCTLAELDSSANGEGERVGCPKEAGLGNLSLNWSKLVAGGTDNFNKPVSSMVPPHGVALQLGINYIATNLFINNDLLAGGDYPIQASVVNAPPAAPVLTSRLTIWGEAGQEAINKRKEAIRKGEKPTPEEEHATLKPFLTLPTGCRGPLKSTIEVDSYQNPGVKVKREEVTRNAAGTPVGLTGCSLLRFPPSITVALDTTDASTSSGLTVGVHVPQTAAGNPAGLAESALRDTTVMLPEGVALNPAGADGLEACSEGLAGFTGFGEFNPEAEPGVRTSTFTPELPSPTLPGMNFCPDGSKIGTVKIKTPLLEHELEGSVYLASQDTNPFGSLVAMYLVAEDPVSGSLIKLAGEVQLTATGQIVTTFKNTPDVPFEDLELHFFGGERAPLTTPSRCGTYTTNASFTPWDGNGPVSSSSSFQIEHGPGGGPCPGQSLPFNPSLTAGTTSNQAGGFSPFTMTMSRPDGSQNLQAISLHMPPGLSGLLSGVKLCGEAEGNAGTCGAESEIGETIVSVGVGGSPFSVKGGKVYITGPYEGAPFGLSIVNPAKAGPYDLEAGTPCDCVVVRAKIEVDPVTAALTITSDNTGPYKIPTILKGIPLEIQHVNVTINREHFTFNPTNCNPMSITGSLDSTEGATSALSVPLQATNCAVLGFAPKFAVSTSGKTSKANGASLSVKLTYPSSPFGSQANIAKVKVDLPKQLPSRLTTLQKACTAAQFRSNPAGCPAASVVGHAKAITPLVPVPLEGPAYFVSNGSEAFPNLIVVLQGYGVTVDLVGDTFISKAGITSSTFKTVPDAPVGSFELTLPEDKYSALAANGDLCALTRTVTVKKKVTVRVKGRRKQLTRRVRETLPTSLTMPTEFVAQNGATIHQTTPVSITGCAKAKKAAKKKSKHHKQTRVKRIK